jgi:hypothetical protein
VGLAALRQGRALTQVAIDRRLTLIAFEAMNHWSADGGFNCTSSTRTTSWPLLLGAARTADDRLDRVYGRRCARP